MSDKKEQNVFQLKHIHKRTIKQKVTNNSWAWKECIEECIFISGHHSQKKKKYANGEVIQMLNLSPTF